MQLEIHHFFAHLIIFRSTISNYIFLVLIYGQGTSHTLTWFICVTHIMEVFGQYLCCDPFITHCCRLYCSILLRKYMPYYVCFKFIWIGVGVLFIYAISMKLLFNSWLSLCVCVCVEFKCNWNYVLILLSMMFGSEFC